MAAHSLPAGRRARRPDRTRQPHERGATRAGRIRKAVSFGVAATVVLGTLVASSQGASAATSYQLGSTVLQDDFSRTVTSGWGKATSGQTYSAESSAGASVASGRGQ